MSEIKKYTTNLENSGQYHDVVLYSDHLAAMKVKAITENDWKRLNRVFKTTSDKTIDQDIEIEKLKITIGDMSMLLRMMVTKHRRGKLDEEYCLKVLDYLQRKGLQGNILRALDTKDENAAHIY